MIILSYLGKNKTGLRTGLTKCTAHLMSTSATKVKLEFAGHDVVKKGSETGLENLLVKSFP